MTYSEGRATRALAAFLMIAGSSAIGAGCQGGSPDTSPTSSPERQSPSSSQQQALSAARSPSSEKVSSDSKSGSTSIPTNSVLTNRTSETSSSNVFPHSFDATREGFEATILALGDVELDRSGELTIMPTSATTPDGTFREPEWTYHTRLSEIGRSGDGNAFGRPERTSLADSIVTYHYDQLGADVIYERKGGQLEQRVRIAQRPSGDKDLEIAFSMPGGVEADVQSKGDVIHIRDRDDGTSLLTWHKLIVRDDQGERLEARMAVDDRQLVYRIDDTDAQYPLMVDPLATTNWQNDTNENEESSSYGNDITIRGDFDGNGYDDLLVGQSKYGTQSNPAIKRGRVLMYLADSSGLSNRADWVVEGSENNEQLGATTVTLDDLNGDGADEIALGGFGFGSGSKGRALLYTGSPNLSKQDTRQQNSQDIGSNVWSFQGDSDDSRLGFTLAPAGDVNCDGIADLVVGAPGWNGFQGRVRVFYGSSSAPYFDQQQADWIREGQSQNSQGVSINTPFLGGGIASAGNVDGDTNQGNDCDDLLVGAPFRKLDNQSGQFYGRTYLFRGSSSGLGQSPSWSKNGIDGSRFGIDVAGIGDVDDDGLDDIAAGGWSWTVSGEQRGKVFVYHGSSQSSTGLESNTAFEASGEIEGAQFSISLDGADLNNDAYSDLVVGADKWSDPSAQNTNPQGRVRVFFGTANGLQEAWTENRQQRESRFGNTVATGGDIDDDGNHDLVVSAPSYDANNVSSTGRVFYFRGRSTCYINQTFYRDGEKNPDTTCQICDVSKSRTDWSTDSSAVGNSCDPNSECIVNATCSSGGKCTGSSKSCDDNNPCTADSCDPSSGCVNDPQPKNGDSCPDDGLSCTTDVCRAGTCEHEVDSGKCAISGTCYDQNDEEQGRACSECRPSVSQTSWSPAPQGTDCDDGLQCNVNEVCNGNQIGDSACGGGEPKNCRAQIRGCAERTRCTEGDRCNPAGAEEPNGTICDDQDPCTVNDTCNEGFCTGTPKDCSAKDGPCQVGKCVVQNGQATCIAEPRDPGTNCNDGDACTVATCNDSGSCTVDSQVSCDDMNPCTTDSCDADQGCINQPKANGTECGDARCNDQNNYVPAPTCQPGMSAITCEERQAQDCGAYKCQLPQGCPTTCSSTDDCKEGNFCIDLPNDSDGDRECYDNRQPEADAGSDQRGIVRNQIVSLDGSQSSDPDGDDLNYTWELADASCEDSQQTAELQRLRQAIQNSADWTPNEANTAFRAPAPDCPNETLTFELTVDDGEFDSPTASTTVEYGDCDDRPLAVIAGQPSQASWGETITLDASDSRPGCGDDLEEYSWSYTPNMPELETEQLSDGQLEVTFPDVCVEDDTAYTFNLTVFDGFQNSDPKTHVVTVPGEVCGGDELDEAEPTPELDAGTDAGEDDAGTADTGTSDAGTQADTRPASDLGSPAIDQGTTIPQRDDDLAGSGCSTTGDSKTAPASGLFLLLLAAGGYRRLRRRRS